LIQRGLTPQIKLTGHADQTGQESKNASLSIERAEAVRHVMTARGLPESIFAVDGMGAKQPFRTALDADTNRRVEFRVSLPEFAK
jgi:outer membrane protein OmpA-like peptidoglycan-associated protein